MSIVVGSEQVTKQDPGHMAGEQRPVSGAVLASDVKVRVGDRPVGRAVAPDLVTRERDARAQRLAAATPETLRGRRKTNPECVDLRMREWRPLSRSDADRLARLVEMYDEKLRRKTRARLEYKRDADADDIVQAMWLELSQRMDTLRGPDEGLYPLLVVMTRYQELEVVADKRRRDHVLGAAAAGDDRDVDERLAALAGREDTTRDDTACAVLELLEGAAPAWSACYADAIAALPARQREVLELRCVDGMTTPAIGARLGVTKQSAQYHLRKALDALRPTFGVEVEEGLPEGYERLLTRLPAAHQEVVRLKLEGLTDREVERRVGYAAGTVRRAYESAQRSLRQMARDRQADVLPEPTPAGRACAEKCAAGCYLRAGR